MTLASASNMSTEALVFTQHSYSESETLPIAPIAQQAPALELTTFFSLPRELRDVIYSYLFEAVYKQSRPIVQLDTPPGVRPGAGARVSDRLAIMQASRRLWEECSTILYGEHLFRFHVGSTTPNATLLTQRTADLMQDIEIGLGPCKWQESVRILILFATSYPQIPRKSCLIKLQFRRSELLNENVIEALRRLTGFKVLTFELDAPDVVSSRQPGAPIPWVSGLLALIYFSLTAELGPGVYANSVGHRRLVFKPRDHEIQELE